MSTVSSSLRRMWLLAALLFPVLALSACQSVSLNPSATGADIRFSGSVRGTSGATRSYDGTGLSSGSASVDGSLASSAPTSHLRLVNSAFARATGPGGGATARTADRTIANTDQPREIACRLEMTSQPRVFVQNSGTATLTLEMTLGPPTLAAQTYEVTWDFRLKPGDPSKIQVLKGPLVIAEFGNGGAYDARHPDDTCTLKAGVNVATFQVKTGATVPAGGEIENIATISTDSKYDLTSR